jgi:hypothetical protein
MFIGLISALRCYTFIYKNFLRGPSGARGGTPLRPLKVGSSNLPGRATLVLKNRRFDEAVKLNPIQAVQEKCSKNFRLSLYYAIRIYKLHGGSHVVMQG